MCLFVFVFFVIVFMLGCFFLLDFIKELFLFYKELVLFCKYSGDVFVVVNFMDFE